MHILIRPRKPWLALAMSFVLPGFGQIYNGDANKAIWLFLAFALLSIPVVSFVALYLSGGWMMPILVASLLIALAIWIYGMVDAWRSACGKTNYSPVAWQISGIYALVFLCCLLAQWFLIDYVRNHLVQSFYIPSNSMEPGILRGDILFADMRYNCPGCKSEVRRGDIAIFVYPNNRTRYYIKRIVALPGDSVRIEGHRIWINEQSLTTAEKQVGAGLLITESIDGRKWQVRWSQAKPQSENLKLVVPAGQVFVLGDNRSSAHDSRRFGTVPLADVVGKARQIWFSKEPDARVRWKRFGTVPE